MTPNQVADAMWIAGWGVPLGIQVHSDGSYVIKDADVHKAAIHFYDVALAVCQAESSFNPLATNGNAKGLWQIMTSVHTKLIADEIHRWEVELGRKPNIYHPLVNTSVARVLYQQSGWKPWEVYTTGAYRKYLGHGAAAMKFLLSPAHINRDMESLEANLISDEAYADAAGIIGGPIAGVTVGLPDTIGKVLEFVKGGAMSIGVFALGAVLLILGVVYLVSQSKAGKAVIGNTPAGIAKKVAGK